MNILDSEIIPINNEQDIVISRKKVREEAILLNFSVLNQTKLVTAASELARNIINYATSGILEIHRLQNNHREGIQLIFRDNGPGIENIDRILAGGYTTRGGLGLGVSGSKKLVDEFEISSEVGKGTCIKLIMWK